MHVQKRLYFNRINNILHHPAVQVLIFINAFKMTEGTELGSLQSFFIRHESDNNDRVIVNPPGFPTSLVTRHTRAHIHTKSLIMVKIYLPEHSRLLSIDTQRHKSMIWN